MGLDRWKDVDVVVHEAPAARAQDDNAEISTDCRCWKTDTRRLQAKNNRPLPALDARAGDKGTS